MTQLGLLQWTRPLASPSAPPGVQRAARAGGRVDSLILATVRRHVGEELSLADLWREVDALVACAPDTPRRRLDALADQGLVTLGEPTRLGCVVIVGVAS